MGEVHINYDSNDLFGAERLSLKKSSNLIRFIIQKSSKISSKIDHEMKEIDDDRSITK